MSWSLKGILKLYEKDSMDGLLTVDGKEFIEEVLKKHPGEWGDIELKNLGARTKYRYGTLVKQNFADQLLDSKIVKAYAVGGYSNMDYILTIDLEVPGKDGNATESKNISQNGNSQSALPFRCTSEQIETLDSCAIISDVKPLIWKKSLPD